MLKVSPFVRAVKGEDGPELWITGEIGVDMVFGDVQRALTYATEQNAGTPVLNIYSHGGGVDDANAFYGWVEQSGIKAIVRIWGTAMSSAVTYAAAFGRDAIEMHPLATIMIHEASGGTEEMREAGNNGMVAIYHHLSGLSEAKLRAMMAATTTLTAKEAVAMGFAGKVMKSELKLAAMYEAQPIEQNEEPNKMQVTAHVKLSAVDAIKAAATGIDTVVTIDPGAELKTATDIANQATEDRKNAEARVKELEDAEAALKEAEIALKAKCDELEAAKKAIEDAKVAEVTEVTAKLTASEAKVTALTADVAKLKVLPTASAIDLSGDGKAVDPAGEAKDKLSPGKAAVKSIVDNMSESEKSALKMAAKRKAANEKK